jgi:hypothetical protein
MRIDFAPKTALPSWKPDRFVNYRLSSRESIFAGKTISPVDDFLSAQKERSSESGDLVSRVNLHVLKFFALLFLLPGLGGLIFSAMVSTDYLENLPRSPAPSEQRMTPRNVHGTVVYQTIQEDERLSVMEYTSVSVFLVGLLLGIVYLEKWSSARQNEFETDLLEEAEA